MSGDARHLRDVWRPSSHDVKNGAECDEQRHWRECPRCSPTAYAEKHAKHRAPAPLPHVTRRCTGCLSIQCATCYPSLGGAR